MIELKDISIAIGGKTILKECNICFPDGSVTALTGRNGSGKSTLLRVIASLIENYSGETIIDGISSKEMAASQLARHLAIVSTQRVRIPNLTCREVVSLGRAPYTSWRGQLLEKDRQIVEEALEMVGMKAFADRSMDRMSDGECQKVMIARALAQDTRNILLDEPNAFLDFQNRNEVGRLLSDLAHKQGKCIIYSTHEPDLAKIYSDSILEISSEHLVRK